MRRHQQDDILLELATTQRVPNILAPYGKS